MNEDGDAEELEEVEVVEGCLLLIVAALAAAVREMKAAGGTKSQSLSLDDEGVEVVDELVTEGG